MARTSAWVSALVAVGLTAGCAANNGVQGTPFQHTDSGFPDVPAVERGEAGVDTCPGAEARPETATTTARRSDGPAMPVSVAVTIDPPADTPSCRRRSASFRRSPWS